MEGTHKLSSHETAKISNVNLVIITRASTLMLVNNSVGLKKISNYNTTLDEYNLEAAQNISDIKITSFQVGCWTVCN